MVFIPFGNYMITMVGITIDSTHVRNYDRWWSQSLLVTIENGSSCYKP